MRAALGALGCLVVAACAVSAYLRADDKGAAYAVGAAVGSIVFSFGIAALIALAVVKANKRGRVLSPFTALGAAALAVLGLVGTVASNIADDEKATAGLRGEVARGEATCPADEPPIFAKLDGRLTYQHVDPAELKQYAALVAGPGRSGLRVRRVSQDGAPFAAAISVAIEEKELAGFRSGVFESLAEQPGRSTTNVRQVGRLAVTVQTNRRTGYVPQSFALLRSGCRSYLVVAQGDEDVALRVAGAVLGASRTA